MKHIFKELVIALIIMIMAILLFIIFPMILSVGLVSLTLCSIILMFATKSTSLNIIGMFLIAGVIFSFILLHGI